jgi:succinate dehydrogenase / fumarate reductase, flavoprotein subunit
MERAWRNVNLLCGLADPTGTSAGADPGRGQIRLTRETTEPVRPDLLALFEKEELAKYLTEEELYE